MVITCAAVKKQFVSRPEHGIPCPTVADVMVVAAEHTLNSERLSGNLQCSTPPGNIA